MQSGVLHFTLSIHDIGRWAWHAVFAGALYSPWDMQGKSKIALQKQPDCSWQAPFNILTPVHAAIGKLVTGERPITRW